MSAVESVGPQALPALQEQVEQIIAEARRQGASACEVAVSLEQGLSTTVRQREVETVEFNRDQGFGITLYVGQRKGSASTSASGPEAIRETVAAALAIAKHTSEDEASGLADAALMARDVQDFDLFHPWDITPEQAIEQALTCEAAAFAADSRIKNADGTTLSTHQGCRVYGNSHGFIGGYASTRHSLSCVMIAEADGQMQRDYWYDVNRQGNLLADPVSIGQRAAQRAASRLGARPVPTCEVPVLFSAELAGGLFGSFLSAISGGSLYRKSSFLEGTLGQKLFPEWLTIDERPHLMRAMGSAAMAMVWRLTPSRSSKRASWCPTSSVLTPVASSACRAPPMPEACITCSSPMVMKTRRPVASHGAWPAGDRIDGAGPEHGHGRLLPWRGGFLGRERRNPVRGPGSDHRRQHARHVQADRCRG
jgi:PmbA protein